MRRRWRVNRRSRTAKDTVKSKTIRRTANQVMVISVGWGRILYELASGIYST